MPVRDIRRVIIHFNSLRIAMCEQLISRIASLAVMLALAGIHFISIIGSYTHEHGRNAIYIRTWRIIVSLGEGTLFASPSQVLMEGSNTRATLEQKQGVTDLETLCSVIRQLVEARR